ncbi:hypothetical protein BsWGS_09025 [Bradybaena similaris]
MNPRKRETGTQLLARLSSRIDLSSIDSDVFSKAPLSSSSSSLSSSKIIEIYGAEGVGKTEMALHYIAKACLPPNWNGLSIQGLGAKVIFIDTEFKFSVFRLAIVLEKQILAILEKLKQDCKNTDPNRVKTMAPSSFAASSVAAEKDFKVETLDVIKENVLLGREGCDAGIHVPAIHEGSEMLKTFGAEGIDVTNKHDGRSSPSDHISDCHGGAASAQSHFEERTLLTQQEIEEHTFLTAQEIEDLVQEALGRVQVLQVVSSDQLFISLLALEHTLSHDPLLSLVVIDTISAFYWSDKLGDLDNPSGTQSKMSPIAKIISKYVSHFCTTFLVIKSALINSKHAWIDRDKPQSGSVLVSADDQNLNKEVDRSEHMLAEHVEFLGKSWSRMGKKKLVLTRSVDQMGRVTRAVACTDWPGIKEFSCTDDGLQFL